MAKGDIISRLKLESGEFDSKIKRASQELMAYSQHCRKTGLEMGYANRDAKEFAKQLGTMSTTATTARGKVSELSDAFVNLKTMYNAMTDAEKQGQFGKQLAQSLDQLKQRTQQAMQELSDISKELQGGSTGGGGLFGGGKLDGMLQVFGGNLMTKAAGFAADFALEIGSCVQQGIELARQGEGVRIAFERLGRGDILDGLREATHGTVTDIELMKAAVRFNDFKLPVEELGTMLAFAQQKAKDTGQSVDYMVDSIVTGLGRKSLMILDNLGLSAAEIKEKMKQTGDMTKAVGQIIREQMAKAGDYVETAADRATKADVELKNAMEELGRTFQPLTDAGTSMWTTLETGALKFLSSVGSVIAQLTEAGRIAKQYGNMGGGGRVGSQIAAYSNSTNKEGYRKAVIASYESQINQRNSVLAGLDAWRKGNRSAANRAAFDKMEQFGVGRGDDSVLRAQVGALRKQLDEFKRGTIAADNAANATTTPTTTNPKKNTKTEQTELQQNQQKINNLTQEYVKLGDESTEAARKRQEEIQKEIKLLEQRNGLLGLRAEQAQGRLLPQTIDLNTNGVAKGSGIFGKETQSALSKPTQLSDKAMKAVEKNIQKQTDLQVKELKEKQKEDKSLATGLSQLSGGFGQLDQGLAALGIDLGDGFGSVVSGLQGISSILMAIQTIVSAIQAISAIDTIIPFANGGLIGKAAGGMLIPGNSFSGDNLRMPVDGGRGWIGVNSGELILSKSQQNNLANTLAGGNRGAYESQPYIDGEQIFLGLQAYMRRSGKGEIVTANR